MSGIATFICDMLLDHFCRYYRWEDRFNPLLVAFQEWVDNVYGPRGLLSSDYFRNYTVKNLFVFYARRKFTPPILVEFVL